jgi:methylsterol monooxygenase
LNVHKLTVFQYHAYRNRVKNAKADERAAVQKKEMDLIEKEGIKAERLAELGGGQGGMEGVPRGKLE